MAATDRMEGRGMSLRWRLIIGSVLVEIVMLSLLVFNSVRLIERSLTEQMTLRLNEVSVLLSAAVGPSMAAQDYGPVNDIFNAVRWEHGIVYLAVWDNRGRLIVIDGWPADRPLPSVQLDLDDAVHEDIIHSKLLVTVEGRGYGQLQFGTSTHFLKEARGNLLRQSVLIAGVEVLLSVVLLALLGVWLTRHLRALEAASLAVSEGIYDRPLAIQSNDEIGHLARAFNTMQEEIANRMAALHASEERSRSLSALSSDWTWEQDHEFRFTRLDGAFGATPGLREKLLGKQRWELPELQTSPESMRNHQADVRAHRPFRDFEYCVVLEGKQRFYSASGEPLFDGNGIFQGYRGTGKDITVRKQVEEAVEASERKFADLFQLSPLPLALIHSETGQVRHLNESWIRLFGNCDDEALVPSTVADLRLFVSVVLREQFEKRLREQGHSHLDDVQLRSQNGQTLVCEVFGRVLNVGDQGHQLWCVRDVSAQRAAESQLLKINSELEVRVEERTRALEDNLKALQRAQAQLVQSEKLAALGSLVAGVAHELNTPLGNMRVVAGTLHQKMRDMQVAFEKGDIRRAQFVAFISSAMEASVLIERGAERAADLVQSFKQVSVDQGSLKRRSFRLQDLVRDIQRVLQPTLKGGNVQWQISVPDDIVLESLPGPIEQVLTNLIQNAALHACVPSRPLIISLSAGRSDRDVAGVALTVRDDGAGMSAEVARHAFDPYFTTRFGQGGSGLGLYIVYGLVTGALFGDIRLESIQGEGTVFHIWLPFTIPEARQLDE